MRLIRAFEEKVEVLRTSGRLQGSAHLYVGQEAVAARVCARLNADDNVASTHPGHGHAIAKGVDVARMMAELYGRATGTNKGKGGSMHTADASVGMLGATGIVGAGTPIALGAALSAKTRRTRQVAVAEYAGSTRDLARRAHLGFVDAWNGPMGSTQGLIQQFGPERTIETPICEMSFIGAAITRLRPIAELMFVDFICVSLDSVMNEGAFL